MSKKIIKIKLLTIFLVFSLSFMHVLTLLRGLSLVRRFVGLYDGFVGHGMNAKPRVTYTCSFVLLPSLLMY